MSCKYSATVTQQNNYTASITQDNNYTSTVTQQNNYTSTVECNLELVTAVWILADGTWNDLGIWIDGETWNDS